jgi:ADP-ribose pyrophosphatase YjhB (NUDIX family)
MLSGCDSGTSAVQWRLPGGQQEPGEGLEDCVRRRVWETTAIDTAGLPLIPLTMVSLDPASVDHVFLIKIWAEPDPDLNWENQDWAWTHRDDLGEFTGTPLISHIDQALLTELGQ